MPSALVLDNVSFTYHSGEKPRPIFDSLNLSAQSGEFLCIVGPSGVGKSTLFRLITALLKPDAGLIRLGDLPPDADRRGRTGYMPQDDLLLPWRTVLQNAILPLQIQGVDSNQALSRAEAVLEAFGLEDHAHAYPHELSGGLRQRAAFLRTVLGGHDVLLLDEPFGALDALTRQQLQFWLLEQWRRLHKTVLFITHDVEEAVLLADRILVFQSVPVENPPCLTVDLPRPREPALTTTPSFNAIKRKLLDQLGAAGTAHP